MNARPPAGQSGRLQRLRAALPEVSRFIAVGLAAAAVDYGIIALLVAIGMSPYLTRTVSMPIALLAAWLGNRAFTFRTQRPPSVREFGSFAATATVGYALNWAIFAVGLWLGLPLELAFVLGTGIAAVFNFLRFRMILGAK